MATRTTPDIEILVGIEGGGSISGASGVKIRNQLTNIISNINKQQATQLRLKVDQQYIQNQIANAIKTMPPVDLNVKVNPNGGGSGGGSTGGNSAVNQIQKIGSMISDVNRKKAKLLDLPATSKQSVELNRQIVELQKKIGIEAQKYAKTSGKTPTEIKNQVNALNSVMKATDAYNLKVQKINDTYDSLKNKISEYSQKAQSAYINMSANSQSDPTKWVDYDKKYQEFMTKANSIAGGMFNKGDSYEQIKQLQDIVKLYNDLQVLQKGVAAESEKVNRSNANGERAVQKYAENIYNFYKQIKDVAPANMSNNILNLFNEVVDGKWGSDITGLVKRFAELRNEVYKAQADVETFGQKIARVFKQKIGYGIMAAAAMKLRQSLQQLYTNVVEMDSAMTQLRIVTNDTDAAYTRFATNAAKAATSIGASVTDIMKSAETYARLGYTLDESLNLSKTTAQLANVAATDANTATTFMTAILKGFNKTASDAEGIGDILTLVGKKYAISAEELGSALERGGASMYAANNTLEESVALLAAG